MSSLAQQGSSFEETYKTSYSHGLEEIYALETIDLKSIRKISEPESEVKEKQPVETISQTGETQFQFDLGPKFCNWVEPFFLGESIKVLGLTQGAEKSLVDNEKKYLRDLISVDLEAFVLGQGHIDEIQAKLKEYLNGRSTKKSFRLELSSWLRSFFSSSDSKKVIIALASYGIHDLLPLSSMGRAEMKQGSEEQKELWVADVKQECRERSVELLESLQKIVNAFLFSWVEGRLGLVKKRELKERMMRLSDQPKIAESLYTFIEEVCFGGEIPFEQYFLLLEPNLYCTDPKVAEAYLEVVERTFSYFYNPDLVYPLPELTRWLQKELLKQWNGYDDAFIEKALRCSSHFRVRKGIHGELEIRLT